VVCLGLESNLVVIVVIIIVGLHMSNVFKFNIVSCYDQN